MMEVVEGKVVGRLFVNILISWEVMEPGQTHGQTDKPNNRINWFNPLHKGKFKYQIFQNFLLSFLVDCDHSELDFQAHGWQQA